MGARWIGCAPGALVNASLSVAFRDMIANRLLEGTFASGQIQLPFHPAAQQSNVVISASMSCRPRASRSPGNRTGSGGGSDRGLERLWHSVSRLWE
jgi:hypothetical protein